MADATRPRREAAVFSFPTTIIFGAGTAAQLWDKFAGSAGRSGGAGGASRPLLVTDRGLLETPAFETVRAALGGRERLFADVQPNPTDANVRAAADAYRMGGCDCVIALGGGSAIDVAKVIRLIVTKSDKPLMSFKFGDDVGKLPPFLAMPTTAGTGSEVGRSSIVTIDGVKRGIFHPALLADLVILDPTLTVDLPGKLTAATGADALTHCIESFTSPEFHPLCDGIALEGITLINEALPFAVKQPRDLEARGLMQIGATMGGIAFQKDLGAAHSLAHPLSALCGLHHGTANALVLPTVMEFNAERKPGLYRRVAIALGCTDPTDACAIASVQSLLYDIGLTGGLRSAGVKDDQLDALTDQAFADSCHKTNAVPVTRDDLRALYQQSM
jgi:alcohol dehydrogenase class IV